MDDSRTIVRDNVRRLLGLEAGDAGVAQLMRKTGLKNGTAQRVLEGKTSIGVDLLDKLARKFGLQPWQLLVKGLQPGRVPELHEASAQWPFSEELLAYLASLKPEQVRVFENQMRAAVDMTLLPAQSAASGKQQPIAA